MKLAEPLQIERDLRRWSPRVWVVVVLLVLIAQGTLLLKAPQSLNIAPLVPRTRPEIKFARSGVNDYPLVQLQDPALFAGANVRGFSGAAWLQKAPWSPPAESASSPPLFLNYPGSRTGTATPEPSTQSPPGPLFLAAEATRIPVPERAPEPFSRMSIEGLRDRPLRSQPALPTQYASDALRQSTVQVMVDTDGSVFSARLLNSSGFKPADAEALRIARQLRFAPAPLSRPTGEMASGKVSFDWYTADPTQGTNSVRRQ